MENQYLVVLITTPSMEVAEKIASHLVEQRLAACVNITTPVRSIYRWEGKIERDEEILLICKTRRDLFDPDFTTAVKALHPYTVPEIIALPIEMGSATYLDWIQAETRS